MRISEKKMKVVIDNYFKAECNINTSIKDAFEKGFRIGVIKGQSVQPETIMCKYCNRKPVFDSTGHYELWSNKETIATGAYSSLAIGVDASGKLIMIGGGDDDTEPYYPKYCPECGRKLIS